MSLEVVSSAASSASEADLSSLTDGDMDSIMCEPCDQGSVEVVAPGMCDLCKIRPKKRNQRFCEEDHNIIATIRSTFRQGKGNQEFQAFKLIVKTGGGPLKKMVSDWTAEMMGFGKGSKRPPIDFLQYAQNINIGSNVQVGTDLAWMSVYRFQDHQRWCQPYHL